MGLQVRFIGLIVALFLCCALPLQAIEVQLEDRTVQADKVVYNGNEFTITLGSQEFIVPQEQVRYIDADLARIADLDEDLAKAQRNLEARDVSIGTLEEQLAKAQKTLHTRDAEINQLNTGLKSIREELGRVDPAELRSRITSLERERSTLQATINRLQDQMRAGNAPDAAPPVVLAPPSPGEAFWTASKVQGLVDVRGTLQNPGEEPYQSVIIEVSAYGEEDALLDTNQAVVTNLLPAAEATWETDLEVDDPDAIKRVDVRVADVFTPGAE